MSYRNLCSTSFTSQSSNTTSMTEEDYWMEQEFERELMIEEDEYDCLARELTQCSSPSSFSQSSGSWSSDVSLSEYLSTDTTASPKLSSKRKESHKKGKAGKRGMKQTKPMNENLMKLGQIYAMLQVSRNDAKDKCSSAVEKISNSNDENDLDFDKVCAKMSDHINLHLADIYVKSLKGDFPYNNWSKRKNIKPTETKRKRSRNQSEVIESNKRHVAARSSSFTEIRPTTFVL